MRLIHASSGRFAVFDDELNIPPYAILSHTWTGSEITLQEWTSQNWLQLRTNIQAHSGDEVSAGLYKIARTCQQALSDGLEYCWVDTCCIDKTSSTELSQAINSMFRWYQNADVCYAYIDDVELGNPTAERDGDSGQDRRSRFYARTIADISEENFGKARWFTRGWTLQELIAPTHMVFYVKNWTCVGNKVSLKTKLARITGIDEHVLAGAGLTSVTIAKRMSWAARRRTTRTEDIAYCLLGLFDVNMSLQYGEGERAFVRLQEKIMKYSDDQSLLAWQPCNAEATGSLQQIELIGRTAVSIFAPHPRNFEPCKDVISLGGIGQRYSLTNKGVRLKVPLDNIDHECGNQIHVVVLECRGTDSYDRYGVVVLKVQEASLLRFARLGGQSLVKVKHSIVESVGTSKVYLCTKMTHGFIEGLGWGHEWMRRDDGKRRNVVEATTSTRDNFQKKQSRSVDPGRENSDAGLQGRSRTLGRGYGGKTLLLRREDSPDLGTGKLAKL